MDLGPLRFRSFRVVWFGESVSMFGDYAFTIAFAWLVLDVTGSPATLAGVLISNGVARGLLLLVGGAVIDRVSPRNVMIGSHLLRALIMVGLVVLLATGTPGAGAFFVIAVVFGIADAFFSPASAKLIPDLLPVEQLPRGNALIGVAEQTGRLLGPVVGGVLIGFVSDEMPFIVNAVTFLMAAAFLLAAPNTPAVRTEEPTKSSIRRDLRDGFALAGRSVDIRIVLVLLAVSTLTYSGLFGAGLPALARTFDNGATTLGLLVASWGFGQLVGTLGATVTGLPYRWGHLIIAP